LIYLIFIDAASEDGQKINTPLGKLAEEKVDDGAKEEDQEKKPKEDITDAAKDEKAEDKKD
jgi:hypothetical protein